MSYELYRFYPVASWIVNSIRADEEKGCERVMAHIWSTNTQRGGREGGREAHRGDLAHERLNYRSGKTAAEQWSDKVSSGGMQPLNPGGLLQFAAVRVRSACRRGIRGDHRGSP